MYPFFLMFFLIKTFLRKTRLNFWTPEHKKTSTHARGTVTGLTSEIPKWENHNTHARTGNRIYPDESSGYEPHPHPRTGNRKGLSIIDKGFFNHPRAHGRQSLATVASDGLTQPPTRNRVHLYNIRRSQSMRPKTEKSKNPHLSTHRTYTFVHCRPTVGCQPWHAGTETA